MGILEIMQALCVSGLLIFASVCDLRSREIPNTASAIIAVCGFICPEPFKLWGLVIAILFFALALFSDKIGGGDVKIVAALSLVLGLEKGLVMLFCASFALLVFHGIRCLWCRLSGRKSPSRLLPFVPFLTLGYFCTLIV